MSSGQRFHLQCHPRLRNYVNNWVKMFEWWVLNVELKDVKPVSVAVTTWVEVIDQSLISRNSNSTECFVINEEFD